ncbi:MAG: hypothetical protein AAF631_11365 [Pseudomonadota bacterium]
MLPEADLADLKKVQAALKTEIIKAKSKIVPWRFYFDHDFGTDGKKDLIVVGKTPPATLKALKSGTGKVRAEGECRLIGDELRLKDDSGALDGPKLTKLKKALKEYKIKVIPTVVEDFEGGAGAAEHARVLAESKRKLVLFSNRVAVIGNKGGEAKTDADKVMAQLGKLRAAIGKGADSPKTGKRLCRWPREACPVVPLPCRRQSLPRRLCCR